MEKLNVNLQFLVFDGPEDLSEIDRKLLESATDAISNAYAPYSAFKVGAAVLLESDKIITGNNQENVAYPSGLCAERVALFYAASQFPDKAVKTIAVSASALDFDISEPVTPCGSCRQVMSETENRSKNSIRIIMRGESGKIYIAEGVNNLLPLMFHAEELKK